MNLGVRSSWISLTTHETEELLEYGELTRIRAVVDPPYSYQIRDYFNHKWYPNRWVDYADDESDELELMETKVLPDGALSFEVVAHPFGAIGEKLWVRERHHFLEDGSIVFDPKGTRNPRKMPRRFSRAIVELQQYEVRTLDWDNMTKHGLGHSQLLQCITPYNRKELLKSARLNSKIYVWKSKYILHHPLNLA